MCVCVDTVGDFPSAITDLISHGWILSFFLWGLRGMDSEVDV